ncbi:unnamed protein product [Blumeria hordei]|uniref:DNA-directed RNA polymerase n=1 Tax=Blumeria hordei TaxID=2867405 RepID=A0A383UUJ7_BLUHO|nr:unnamed protein product [Blumeria hordei]
MLSRAARRKATPNPHQARIFCNQGCQNLLLRSSNHFKELRHVSVVPTLQRPGLSQKKTLQEMLSRPSRRELATAFSFTSDEVPFEKMNGPPPSIIGMGNRMARPDNNSKFGSPDLYNMDNNLESRVLKIRPGKLGISGDYTEVVSVFEACVHVGRLERARNILDKLNEKGFLTEFESTRCINLYLRAAVEHIMMNPRQELQMQILHRWFETSVKVYGVSYDSETVGYMVKLSLQSIKGRRDRLVQQYMDFLDEESFLELIEAGILTEQEIGHVTRIHPKFNFALELGGEQYEKNTTDKKYMDKVAKGSSESSVLETKQKGLGLTSLKKSLSIFSELMKDGIDLSKADKLFKREVQQRLEVDAVDSAIDRWREENNLLTKMGLNPSLQSGALGAKMWKWKVELEERLVEEISLVNDAEDSEHKGRSDIDRCMYGPLLRILPASQLAAITIIACMTLMGQHTDKRTPLSTVVLEIGKNIEDESTMYLLQKAQKENVWPTELKRRLNPEFYVKLKRSRGAGAAAKHMNRYFAEEGAKPWPLPLKAKVGAVLMSHLMEVAKVSARVKHPETNEELVQVQSAFTHAHQYKKGKKTGIVIMNKVLIEQLQREPVHSLLAKHLPMVVEPDDWRGFEKGGYIVYPARIMRIKQGDEEQRHYCEAAISQGEMSKVVQGLNVLGKTSWRINQQVFDIMLQAWNTGEAIANFPPLNPKIDVPPEPVSTTDPLERGRWIRKVKIAQNIKTGMHSQRCFQNFQLEIAQALKDKEFYFPHNVDFRGRAYPLPPYLNHIGADHCRGLLIFGRGKQLGESGLKWLKIHISNVYGYDKASLQDRESFTSSKLEEIYDSALNPMNGKKWWLEAEDPWQCLAACIELKNALESPDPTKFVSHLPVHQDGTCNGLQHYAALGGDTWGAKQVNLEPGEKPADVYSAVADLVRIDIAKDKEAGNPLAAALEGKITRKTVKQTVMTNVYGVTFIGASAQVRKQLAASQTTPSIDQPESESQNRHNDAAYVARKIFTALSTMFRGAHDIQYWLAECATRITTSLNAQQISRLEAEWDNLYKSHIESLESESNGKKSSRHSKIDDMLMFKSGVIWTSPLGLPVVQPYRTLKGKVVRTNMQNINLCEPSKNSPVSKRKQLQGFPPNFIHSLDASHMILSAIGCDKLGLSFAAVHDSFWTHACDIDVMNNVLRESFIEIHSEDIIGRLSSEFKARYHDSMYLAQIKAGTPVHRKIVAWRSSQRILSNIKSSKASGKSFIRANELLLEFKRIKLLASSNPKDVEEGNSMETPGSIYQLYCDEKDEFECSNSKDVEIEREQTDQDKQCDLMTYQSNEEMVDTLGEADENSDDGGHDGVDAESDDYADILAEVEAEVEAELTADSSEFDAEFTKFEKSLNKSTIKAAKKIRRVDHIWLPLTIPKIPEKGDFDVTRLRESKYFFS